MRACSSRTCTVSNTLSEPIFLHLHSSAAICTIYPLLLENFHGFTPRHAEAGLAVHRCRQSAAAAGLPAPAGQPARCAPAHRLFADYRCHAAAGGAQPGPVPGRGAECGAAQAVPQLGPAGGSLHQRPGESGAPADAHDGVGTLWQRKPAQGADVEPHGRLRADRAARCQHGGGSGWQDRGDSVLVLDPQRGAAASAARGRPGSDREGSRPEAGQADRDGAVRHGGGAGSQKHCRLHRGRTVQCRGRAAGRGQGAALYRRCLA